MPQGNDVLQQRVWRMLHVDADPLDGQSCSRFRLRLRDADDAFFQANVMEVGWTCGMQAAGDDGRCGQQPAKA